MMLPVVSASDLENFSYVSGPCYLKFPEDHGPHENFRTEWWYYTGNVSDTNGMAFGFQLTFFRFRIQSEDLLKDGFTPSAWRTSQLILAHAALTDISGKKHVQAEQMARQALDIAGAFQNSDRTNVFIRSWFLNLMTHSHHLEAATREFSLKFILTPLKNPVLHGDHGYSRKGRKAESASCYYSFTRLKAEGTIRIGEKKYDVNGFAWMDHEFSTNPLEPDLVGWDWFSIQMDNRTELMAYFLRHKDGTFSDASSATFVTKEGESTHLTHKDLVLEILDTWKSNKTGAVYPSRWRLLIPVMNLTLDISPAFADQEMRTTETSGVIYWEGSILADGLQDGKKLSGKGYTELTGYAEPFDAPM